VNGLWIRPTATLRPWSSYANDPLTAVSAETLAVTLRSFLKEKLPDHMIPSAFVPLRALPLNANGKVDRRALPAPEAFGMHAGRLGVAPRTEVEKTLAVIWQDLLGLDRVRVDDNFFEAGGHSLLLIRLQARVNDAFATEVSMMDLFRCPTIRLLAKLLSPEESLSAAAMTATGGRAEKQRDAIIRRKK
jgi:acyl carrier protein